VVISPNMAYMPPRADTPVAFLLMLQNVPQGHALSLLCSSVTVSHSPPKCALSLMTFHCGASRQKMVSLTCSMGQGVPSTRMILDLVADWTLTSSGPATGS